MIARCVSYLLHYIRHYNKCSKIYVIYKAACMSSLIRTYRRTDRQSDGHRSWHMGFCYEADSHKKEALCMDLSIKPEQQLWNNYRSKTHLNRIISRTYLNLNKIKCSLICRHVIYYRWRIAGLFVSIVGKATLIRELIENSSCTRKWDRNLLYAINRNWFFCVSPSPLLLSINSTLLGK